MPPQDPEQAHWFDKCLRPHEPMLRAWLKGQFPTCYDIDDVIQESYVRVLKAHETTEVESPKAFLFATARNVVLMQLRHRQVERTDCLAEMDAVGILDDSVDIPNAVVRAQELELLTKAIQSLPTRCRQIITLRKIYGVSQKDIAAQLGISEHTVEAQGTIGLRKIGEYFARMEGAEK
jgi:RNA polymerase sigma factor (sigma-70 family)